MEGLEEKRREKKHVSGKKKTFGVVAVDACREAAGSSLSMFSLFLFYQARSREDYRHRGITILKLLQLGGDLQPVM